ncbi:MAG: steroid 5-alpha reductase, partial [Cyanobacteria bacterium P01_F01_bin.153]
MTIKMKYPINLHKGLTLIVVLGMMFWYDNFTLGPWIYLALHGSYGFLWLLKDRVYPDKRWEEEIPITLAATAFLSLAAYWVAPFLLISSGNVPPSPLIAGAIACNSFGLVLHYAGDA